ncbi:MULTISPECIES: hypothetical protein [Mesorhizobium]|uniref:hypothetical protein n=1 Tax=Mesorhizobium sp. TaxID=1871066 RepID=UPI000A897AA4|nr:MULTISPECIES: hypothetical protein [Mesorhizobium]
MRLKTKNPPRQRVVGANQHHTQINSINAVTKQRIESLQARIAIAGLASSGAEEYIFID